MVPEQSLGGNATGDAPIMMTNDNAPKGGETDAAGLPGFPSRFSRRSFLIGSAASCGALGLGGCAATDGMSSLEAQALYGPVSDKKFAIPAADISKVDPKYYRRKVRYESKEAPGTIVVDPANYYVYRIEGNG